MLPFGNTVITLDQDLVLNICVSKVWFQSLQGFLKRRLKYEKLTDPDISDYEFDADDLLLMPIIIPKFDN